MYKYLYKLFFFIFIIDSFNVYSQYCVSSALSNSGSEIISQVIIGNSSTTPLISCNGYTDNTNLQINSFLVGSSIPFTIYTNKCAGWTGGQNTPKGCKIYMDWNNDGDFYDSGENVYTSFIPVYNWINTFIANINIPQGTQCTQVRTRIIYTRTGNSSGMWPNSFAIQPCGFYNYGETEDFIIPIDPCNNFDIDAGSDSTICYNDTIILNPEIVQGGNYQWTPNLNISNPNIPNPSIYPQVTTTYYLTVDSTANFSATDSVTIYVNQNPMISISSDQTICNGATPNDLLTTNIQGATYSWSPTTNLNSPNSFQTSFTSALLDTVTYSVTVNLNGCLSTESVNINVNPIPTAVLSAIPNPACLGDDIQILANTSIPVLRYRFQFNNSNSWQNITTSNQWGWGSVNPVLFNNITTTTQFRVRVREDWGCTTGPWSPVLTVPVINVTPPPIIHN